MSRITPLAANVAWLEPIGVKAHKVYGDYEDGVIDLGAKFYGVWADSRDGQPATKLWGASFN